MNDVRGKVYRCEKCNWAGASRISWQRMANGFHHHIRAACFHCGAWIKWEPITEDLMAKLGDPPPCQPSAQGDLFGGGS